MTHQHEAPMTMTLTATQCCLVAALGGAVLAVVPWDVHARDRRGTVVTAPQVRASAFRCDSQGIVAESPVFEAWGPGVKQLFAQQMEFRARRVWLQA